MAITFTSVIPVADSVGNRRLTVTDITLDATAYTTGGYVLAPGNLGLSKVDYANASVKTVVAAGPGEAFLDCSNPLVPKLKLNNAAAEMANATATLTGVIVEVQAWGEL